MSAAGGRKHSKALGKKKPAQWYSKLINELPDMEGIESIELIEDNQCHWLMRINGPDDSLYKGGTFDIRLNFGKDFPLKPPQIVFETCIFHMNITSKGQICLELLERWNSNKNVLTDIFDEMFKALKEPILDSPINTNAYLIFSKNDKLYNETAIAWTKKFAANVNEKGETKPISFEKARELIKKQIVKNQAENNKDDEKKEDNNNNNRGADYLDKIEKIANSEHSLNDPMFDVDLTIVANVPTNA